MNLWQGRLQLSPSDPSRRRGDATDAVLDKVNTLLGNVAPLGRWDKSVPVFVNRDPRGYALKIKDTWMREHNAALHRDWGGYGIIAPEIEAV